MQWNQDKSESSVGTLVGIAGESCRFLQNRIDNQAVSILRSEKQSYCKYHLPKECIPLRPFHSMLGIERLIRPQNLCIRHPSPSDCRSKV